MIAQNMMFDSYIPHFLLQKAAAEKKAADEKVS